MTSIKSKITVCVAVGLLGIIALILGLAAKSHTLKSSDAVTYSADASTCSFITSSPAAAVGVIGALCILTAQIIANAAGGCVCCCPPRPSGVLKKGATLCLVFSWFFTCVSFLLLFITGLLNSSVSRKTKPLEGPYVYCPIAPSWPFPAGGVLALVAAVLAIFFYLLAASASEARPLPQRGQVEVPPYK